MIKDDIRTELYNLQDKEYRDFQSKLIPDVDVSYFVGVRTPDLRKLAKLTSKREDIDEFLSDLPHELFDENQLHAFIISDIKDFGCCLAHVESFLPYVNNWATCDQMSPKVLKQHKAELLGLIDSWLASGETYTVRFAIKMLMEHFLAEDFKVEYAEKVATVTSDEYYVKMMVAWYFATALAKNYDEVVPFIENKRLEKWTHNKAIQKSVESYRITDDQKEYLKTYKIK
ncbi:MAG: DNA alkylation repair protein [Pseudobutyrivibrio sp.]|nr:DNA alkylation repair protein [Pseudobutyrivibrio sp.]